MQAFLIKLIMAIFGKVGKMLKLKSEEAKPKGELETRLEDQIRKDGWKD